MDDLTRLMSRLSACLRERIPETDQWTVQCANYGTEDTHYEVVEVRIRREREGQGPLNYGHVLTPECLTYVKDIAIPAQWVAEEWLREASRPQAGIAR